MKYVLFFSLLVIFIFVTTKFQTVYAANNYPSGCPASGHISAPYGHNIYGYSGVNSRCEGLTGCHNGIDIGTQSGSPIYSTLDGEVTASTSDLYKGNYISITNYSSNITVTFEHMGDRSTFNVGDFVAKDSVVGFVGDSGEGVTGPHVHYKIESGFSLLNPFKYVSLKDADPTLLTSANDISRNNYNNKYPQGAGHNSENLGQCTR